MRTWVWNIICISLFLIDMQYLIVCDFCLLLIIPMLVMVNQARRFKFRIIFGFHIWYNEDLILYAIPYIILFTNIHCSHNNMPYDLKCIFCPFVNLELWIFWLCIWCNIFLILQKIKSSIERVMHKVNMIQILADFYFVAFGAGRRSSVTLSSDFFI